MPGFRDIITRFSLARIYAALLILFAGVMVIFFIFSWPKRLLYLRQYLPEQISLKWFTSFSSLNTPTRIQLAQYYNNFAEQHANAGRLDEAMVGYNKAIENYISSPIPYYNRACLYLRLGNLDLAIRDFNQVIDRNARFLLAYEHLGLIYTKQDEFKKAIKCFTKVINIDPHRADAYYHRALVYYQLKEVNKYKYDLQRSQELALVNR